MRIDAARLQMPAKTTAAERAEINRRNALKSTGPVTQDGKATSSLNAGDEAAFLSAPKIQAMPGLTGRSVLLHSADAAHYQRHIEGYEQEYKPVGLRERELVQSLADTQWRLQRIPGLEMAIYALGHAESETHYDGHSSIDAHLIELDTFLKYEKQLRNLQVQEGRLQRRYEKERAELRALQTERRKSEETAQPEAGFEFSSASETQPQAAPQPGSTSKDGFEFSTVETESLHTAAAPKLNSKVAA